MAQLIVSQPNSNTPAIGGLFAGISFFLLQKVPSRSSYIDKIQSNGGRVVRFEASADHIIADHVRKDAPPGSISYKFIDASIRDGGIADPADHPAGKAADAVREVGSVGVPGRNTRTPFTAQDDRDLWLWVEKAKAQGGLVKGNEIYKQLEKANGRHTFQAWRDRYIKKLMDRPPAGVDSVPAANGGEREHVEAEREETHVAGPAKQTNGAVADEEAQEEELLFDKEDFDALFKNAADICQIDESQMEDAWLAWANANPKHEAHEWREFWEETVQPFYVQQRAEQKKAKRRKRDSREEVEERPMSRREGKKAVKAPVEDEDADQHMKDREEAVRNGSQAPREETPASQKRKRETPASARKAAKYGRKKQKPDFSDLFQPEEGEQPLVPLKPKPKPVPVNSTLDPIEIPSNDEDERTAPAPQANHEIEEQEDVKEEVHDDDFGMTDYNAFVDEVAPALRSDLPTSELRHGADRQVRRESRQAVGDELLDSTPRQATSNLPTSDANRAAAQQLRRETAEDEDGVGDEVMEQLLPYVPTFEANRDAERQLRPRKAHPIPTVDAANEAEQLKRTPRSERQATGPRGIPAAMWDDSESQAFAKQIRAGLSTPRALEAAGLERTASAGRNHKNWLRKNRPELLEEVDGAEVQSQGSPVLHVQRQSRLLAEQTQSAPLQRELEEEDAEDVEEQGDITLSTHLLEHGSVEDGLPGEESIEANVDDAGDLLTEANLASQQAEHKEQLLRGQDLEEDDMEKDQTDFVEYLQALQRGGKIGPGAAIGPVQVADDEPKGGGPEERPHLPSDGLADQTQYTQNEGQLLPEEVARSQQETRLASAFSPSQTQAAFGESSRSNAGPSFAAPVQQPTFPDLPLSSQADIDDALEASQEWPYSPQQSKKQKLAQPETGMRPESQSLAFETQIPYPQLPSQDDEDQADEDMFTTQPPAPEMDGVQYPSLQEQMQQAISQLSADDVANLVQQPEAELELEDETYVLASGEKLPLDADAADGEDGEDAEDEDGDLVDLSVPAPDGGFGFSSSPVRLEARQAAGLLRHQAEQHLATALQDEDVDDAEEATFTQHAQAQTAAIELSSAGSSSSPYVSSEPPSPRPAVGRKALETQDIVNAETQQPDLGMPLPPDSDDGDEAEEEEEEEEEEAFDPLFAKPVPAQAAMPAAQHRQPVTQSVAAAPSAMPQPFSSRPTSRRQQPPPQQPSQTQSQQINLAETQTLPDEDVDDYISTMALRHNISEKLIIDALKATSMRPQIAEMVMFAQRAGKGVPRDVPGVWSEEEDRIIEGGDAKAMGAVVEKHGGWEEVWGRLEWLGEWRGS